MRRIIDWKAYWAEIQKLDILNDPEEVAVRQNLLDELTDRAAAYYQHINEYNLVQHCKAIEARGLRFKPLSKQTVARRWDTFFASGLSREVKRKIYYSQYKWHMFSYEQVPAKEGADAKRSFNRCKKGAAYLFFQHTNEAWYIENAQLLTAADFMVNYSFQKADLYIFDANGEWAFVRTHEPYCGPYFLRNE